VIDPAQHDADRAPPDASARSRRAATWLLLAAAALAWSGAVARGGFAFDDREMIHANPVVAGELPWTAAFARDYWHHRGDAGQYRPLSALALRADRAAWGERARGFHLTNVALHLAAVALAAAALGRLGLSGRALFAGLLPFAAHPVLADSVAWIAGRTSMIAGIGGTAACLAAAAAPPRAAGALAALALAAGLGGKEDAIAFLPAAVAIAFARSRRHGLAVAAGGAVAVGAAVAARWLALGEPFPSAPGAPLAGEPLGARLTFAGRALLEALRLVAWPFSGPPNYRGMPGFTPREPPPAAALAGWVPWLAAVLLGASALVRARRGRPGSPGSSLHRIAAVALALSALGLLPMLQLVPAGEVFAPRFLYVPLCLAAPAFALSLGRLPRFALAALAATCVAGAWVQAGRYAGRGAYTRAVLAHAPDDARSWNDLGLALEEEGRLADAVDAYGRATRDPSYGRPWSNLGRIALERGAVDEAVELLERAVARAPDQPVARVNLASARLRAGDAAGGMHDYRAATELAPGLAPAWRGLGQAALAAGDDATARAALERALELAPDDRAARALLERVSAR
jgi:tetratricopeptide (TPR) repeat protein